jgi:hypothetical protein
MKQSRLPGALGVLLVVAGFFNVAQAATWGTQVNISTISPCPSFCGGSGGTSEFSVDGGEFVLSSFDTLNNADGDGQGIASLTGSSLLPILGAEGFSGSNSRIGTSAVGMLSYTYTGGTPTTISLDINLDGERGGTTDPGDAFVNSDVAVILGSVDDFITDYPTFIFEVVPGTPGLSVLGQEAPGADLAMPSTPCRCRFPTIPVSHPATSVPYRSPPRCGCSVPACWVWSG